MRAIRVHEFGAPEVMHLEDVPGPTPGPGQVVVRAHAIGVNPVDTYVRAGAYAFLPSLPFSPGVDAAGVIDAQGEGVRSPTIGDHVYVAKRAPGTYAELILCEATEVHPLSGTLSFEQGAGVGVPFATAHRALFGRAGAQPGETVLVHGASGGTGTAVVQLARAHGLTVIGTAGTDGGMQLVRDLGAHHVINHRSPGYLEELAALTQGHGFNVIVEMLANVNLDKDLGLLALRGRVVVVGNRGRVEIDPRQAMRKDSTILGMMLWHVPPEEIARIHDELAKGFAEGTLKPVVGRKFPLTDARKAHVAVMEPGAHGKIVLLP